tara:strand:- start:341 stop:874 length:534 start_codon:yes stop_codon:yes gene_type:complete
MNDNLNDIFKRLENKFDIEEPTIGHFNRFEDKLNANKTKNKFYFLPYIAVAASIILIFGVWLGASFSTNGMELATISSEMEDTQNYFITTIEKELEAIEKERNKDTEQLISDALDQLNKLETQYQNLTLELKESSEDKRIIYAMISNFQQRIDVLQDLLIQIENIKQLKKQNNEEYV